MHRNTYCLAILNKKSILSLIMFIMICMSLLSACSFSSSEPSEETTEEQTIPVDEEYGNGINFSFVDHTGEYNLDYSIKRDETGSWVLRMTGDNSLYAGTKYITDDEAKEFFYYLLHETTMKSLDKYNKTGDSIKESKWWYSLNVTYENKSIASYGYMRHPDEYDSFRIAVTEYLNDLFVNTKYESENNETQAESQS
ncbi:MAG: hypothetical protein ACI4E1_04995 [Lachnospira sp.]